MNLVVISSFGCVVWSSLPFQTKVSVDDATYPADPKILIFLSHLLFESTNYRIGASSPLSWQALRQNHDLPRVYSPFTCFESYRGLSVPSYDGQSSLRNLAAHTRSCRLPPPPPPLPPRHRRCHLHRPHLRRHHRGRRILTNSQVSHVYAAGKRTGLRCIPIATGCVQNKIS